MVRYPILSYHYRFQNIVYIILLSNYPSMQLSICPIRKLPPLPISINPDNYWFLLSTSLYLYLSPVLVKTRPLILLAEDSKIQARMISMVLNRYNFDVEVATDGEMALEMFQASPKYDLILMVCYQHDRSPSGIVPLIYPSWISFNWSINLYLLGCCNASYGWYLLCQTDQRIWEPPRFEENTYHNSNW